MAPEVSDTSSTVGSVTFVDKESLCLLSRGRAIYYTVRKDLDESELGGTVEWSPAGDASAQVLQGFGRKTRIPVRSLQNLRALVIPTPRFRRIAVTVWTNQVSHVTQYLAFLATDEHAG